LETKKGWAYRYLTNASSALDLSKEVVKKFINETQGGNAHQAPKTLAVTDLAKYRAFLTTLDILAEEIKTQVETGDGTLHAYISRARDAAVAFEGAAGTTPAAVDVGSWLDEFSRLCNPDPNGSFASFIQATKDAYNDMFIERGTGPGTEAATGMHITWPTRGEYDTDIDTWNWVLFDNPTYATSLLPQVQAFLKKFLVSRSPKEFDTGVTICGQKAEPERRLQEDPGDLVTITGFSIDETTGAFQVEATLSLDVSDVSLRYGMDLTIPFLAELAERGFETDEADYLYYFGGDVPRKYGSNDIVVSWDLGFYFLNISGVSQQEALYVQDGGNGARRASVLFFPEEQREVVSNLEYRDFVFFDENQWRQLGAKRAFFRFSVDETTGIIGDNLALYVQTETGALTTYTEQPRAAGGLWLPIIQVGKYRNALLLLPSSVAGILMTQLCFPLLFKMATFSNGA